MATDAELKASNTVNAPSPSAAKEALARKPAPGTAPSIGGQTNPDSRWGVENCCVREFWAVIETDGSLVRGRNVLRTTHLGTGIYEVFFTGDVSNGAFVATIGRPGIFTEPPGEITVALRFNVGSNPPAFVPFDVNKGVWIQTFDSTGKPSDRAFHLIVLTH